MSKQYQCIRKIVEILESMREADPEAMHHLVKNRVPCNDKMAEIAICSTTDGNECKVGLLGVINGLFSGPYEPAAIAAELSPEGELLRFVALEPPRQKVTA